MKKIYDWFLSLAIGKGFLKYSLTVIMITVLFCMLSEFWPICGPIYTGIAIYYFIVASATTLSNMKKIEKGEVVEL